MKECRAEGPLTLATVPGLYSHWIAAAGPSGMALNLAAVTDVDSSSLALLIATRRAVERAGGQFEVREVPGAMRTLAQLYGVDFIVDNLNPND